MWPLLLISFLLPRLFVKPTVLEPPPACVDKGKVVIGGDVPVVAKPTRMPPICHHCGLSGHI
jgi:hypothetical protein